MALGDGLEPDPNGSIQIEGSEPSEPSAYLYGPNGFVGVGTGLEIDPDGSLRQQSISYIYCTPAYPELPPTSPPYSCETEVNTAGVTDFTDAWFNCVYLTEFPCVDSSAVTDFSYAWQGCTSLTGFPVLNSGNVTDFRLAWQGCTNLTSFPPLNVSSGTDFTAAWQSCRSLTNFPLLDVSSGTDFTATWFGCTSLTSFPLLDVSSGTSFFGTWAGCTGITTFPSLSLSAGANFFWAWKGCQNLINFPANMFDTCLATNFTDSWYDCALSQQSVDNILVSLDTAGQSNGSVRTSGGTSAAPGVAGLAAKASLEGKGWTVITN